MKTVSFLFSLILSSTGLLAQNNKLAPTIDNVLPPSPNVSALNKFGNIPVGQSTGIPAVGVPIYTWEGKSIGLNVNISLDYHAGGIRLDDMASNIGLGWALNAGGVISRTVRGVYDEMPINGFLDQKMPATSAEGNTYGQIPVNERLLSLMYTGRKDTQNDIFNFSFNGRNGKFVLGKNGDLLVLTQEKIKVQKFITKIDNQDRITKFLIIDEYGYQFVFEDYEISSNTGGWGLQSTYTSSWYLSKIISPSGNDSVNFSYENTIFTYETGFSATRAIPIILTGSLLPYESSGGSGQTVRGKRLKDITFPDGNLVNFQYSTIPRVDLNGDYLLKKITISKGNIKRGFNLNHDYSLNRATLLSVTPFGGASEIPSSPYTFSYVTSPILPQRLISEQDHWGYHTPKNRNGSWFPHEYFRADGGEFPPFREFTGGNRDTDPEGVKAGSMTKITYPTGGYTIFEMEANTAKDNWLEQNEKVTIQLPPFTWKSRNEGLNSDINPAAVVPLVFGGENSTKTEFEIKFNPLGGDCSGTCGLKFEIYNGSNVIFSQQVNFNRSNYEQKLNFDLQNLVKGQTYTLKAYTINLSNYHDYMEVRWKETNVGGSYDVYLSHVQPFVGGIRAKKVTDFTGDSNIPATVKEYEYTLEDGVTSSGSLGFRPVYTYMVYYDYRVAPSLFLEPSYHGNFDFNYLVRTTNSVNDIPYANGSPVTYSRVVEKTTSGDKSLGKTVRYFTSFKEYPVVVFETFPPIPVNYLPASYGLLNKEEFYDSSNTKVKSIENKYNVKTDDYYTNPARVENFRSITLAPVKFLWTRDGAGVDPGGQPHYILMSNFTPVAGRSDLTQTTEKEFANGNVTTTKETFFNYDPEMLYLKERKILNSKNEEIKSVYRYPKDKVNAGEDVTGIYNLMYNANMIKNLVDESLYNGVTHLESKLTDYDKWNNTVGLYKPSRVSSKNLGKNPEVRVKYLNYDTHGNVLSVSLDGGPPECYVWGYGGNLLVAKISNIDYARISSLLGGPAAIEVFRNNKNPTEAQVDAFLAPLRTTGILPDSKVESFTHNSLSGISKFVDEKNMATYYEYDEFQRLKEVKDRNRQVIQSHTYHYKN